MSWRRVERHYRQTLLMKISPLKRKSKAKPNWGLILVIFGVTFLIFAPSLHYDFLSSWDDPEYIVNNVDIRGFGWQKIKAVFSSFYVGNYAPFHILSYSLDYIFWGGASPFGFRVTNYTLHALNAVLLFLLLPHLGIRKGWAFLISLIFAVHPVQVESVVWLTERKNVLSMTFFLLSFRFYIHHGDRGRSKDYFFSLATFILSLFTKAVVVVGPMIFCLYELCFLRERKRSAIALRQLPFALGSLALSVVTYHSQDSSLVQYWGGGPLGTLYTMMGVFVRYLYLCFFPFHLSAIYDPMIHFSIMDWSVLASFTLLSLLMGWMFWDYFKGERRHAFFIAWFFIFLIPVSQIVPINILMADRYLYFPIIGWAGVLGLAAQSGLAGKGGYFFQKGLPLSLAVAVLCYSAATLDREKVWRDSGTLWEDTVRKVPEQGRAYQLLADYYRNIRKFRKASETYWTAIEKIQNAHRGDSETDKGFSAGAHYDLEMLQKSFLGMGASFLEMKEYEQAIQSFESAIEIPGFNAEEHAWLGLAYSSMGQYEEALKKFGIALEQWNKASVGKKGLALKVHRGQGAIYGSMGRFEEALREYKKALDIDPEDRGLLYNLGVTYLNMQRYSEAEKAFLSSRDSSIKTIRVLSHLNLGVVYYDHLFDPDKALYYLRKTLELDPAIPQKEELVEAIEALKKN